jgi:hypothetical protein
VKTIVLPQDGVEKTINVVVDRPVVVPKITFTGKDYAPTPVKVTNVKLPQIQQVKPTDKATTVTVKVPVAAGLGSTTYKLQTSYVGGVDAAAAAKSTKGRRLL